MFNNIIVFFKNLDKDFNIKDYCKSQKITGKKFGETFEYSFVLNKKIEQISIKDDILKSLTYNNMVLKSSREDLYNYCLNSPYKNFMILDGDRVFCAFEKIAKEPIDKKRLYESANIKFPKKFSDLNPSEKDKIIAHLGLELKLPQNAGEIIHEKYPKLFRYLSEEQKKIVLSKCTKDTPYSEKNNLAEKHFPMNFNDLPGNEKATLFSELGLMPKESDLDEHAAKMFPRSYDDLNDEDKDELFSWTNLKPEDLKLGKLELEACIFSVGTKKYCPFIRGCSQLFVVIIPASIKGDNFYLENFDEKKIRNEILLAHEAFMIFVDFLHNNKNEIGRVKNNFRLLDTIYDNLKLNIEENGLMISLDFFSEQSFFPFRELFSSKHKENLIGYFKLFSKQHNFRQEFEKSIIEEVPKMVKISFDRLFLNALVDFSKKINSEFFKKSPVLVSVYNSILQEVFPKNVETFNQAAENNPEINLGVSEFLLTQSHNFSLAPQIKNAINSLAKAEAYAPVKQTKEIEELKSTAKDLILKSIPLNEL